MDLPHWWLTEEILPPDPWAYIVSDFRWADEIIGYMSLKSGVEVSEDKPLGHFPKYSEGTHERIKFAYNIILKIEPIIREYISKKEVSVDFIWKWGEYQKAVSILQTLVPEIKKQRGIKNKDTSKEYARGWYALWHENFIKETGKKTRKEFENFFEPFLLELLLGKRSIPTTENSGAVLGLVKEYAAPIKKGEKYTDKNFKISEGFQQKNFSGRQYRASLELALLNKANLPPVAERLYPLKK